MSNDESSVIAFLNFILDRNHVETSIKTPKSELLELLKDYLSESKMPDDPVLVFEDWEPFLRKSFLIENHLVRYNIYTETLTIEIVPSLERMNRAAETYLMNLKSLIVRAISDLTFEEFERLMGELFQKVPWVEGVNVTRLSRDEGIDFEGTYRDRKSGLQMRLFGQAKHWHSKVGSEAVRTFIGSISVRSGSPSIGIFVSTGGFTDGAKTMMRKAPVRILSYDVNGLADLMIDHGIGVEVFKIEGKTVDELFWKELRE